METKFTKGPWRAGKFHSIEAQFDGEWVQVASISRTRWTNNDGGMEKNQRMAETEDGDTRLIAAAPALFDAAQLALRHLERSFHDIERDAAPVYYDWSSINKLREALALVDEEK